LSLTPLRDVTLRDGSILRIHLGQTGLAEMQRALALLLATSEFPDLDIMYRLLTQTEDDGSVQRHFFGFQNGRLVSFLKYDASTRVPYVCSLGYVFTSEDVRGLGIAQGMCQAAIDNFAQAGGRAAYLSGSGPGARVYQRVGFRPLHGHIMRCVLDEHDSEFDGFYFAGRPIAGVRNLTYADWAMAASLYGQPTDIHIRDYGIQLYSGPGQEITRFQSVIPVLMRIQDAGDGRTIVAEDSSGHLVAIGTLQKQTDGQVLADFLVHDTARQHAECFLKELLSAAPAMRTSAVLLKIARADQRKLDKCDAVGLRVVSETIENTGGDRMEPVVTFCCD